MKLLHIGGCADGEYHDVPDGAEIGVAYKRPKIKIHPFVVGQPNRNLIAPEGEHDQYRRMVVSIDGRQEFGIMVLMDMTDAEVWQRLVLAYGELADRKREEET